MSKRYYACVYGGANERIADVHKEKVKDLGRIITENGFSLVYGAGGTGCMGAAASGVKESGGYVMGVSPDFISDFEEIFPCDNTIMVDTMSERKTIMEKCADIFFIAPGGIGTMDEFFQVLTLKYLKRLSAPIVVLNFEGFYDSLIGLIESLVRQGAVSSGIYDLFDVVKDVNDEKIVKYMEKIKKV